MKSLQPPYKGHTFRSTQSIFSIVPIHFESPKEETLLAKDYERLYLKSHGTRVRIYNILVWLHLKIHEIMTYFAIFGHSFQYLLLDFPL